MTENQKVEQLLQPRYKVLGKFPLSRHNIGDIIHGNGSWISTHRSTVDFSCEAYPILFRKMEWWEDRELKEMPQYVKCIQTPDQEIMADEILAVEWNIIGGKDRFGRWVFPYTKCFLPATEQEYNTLTHKSTNEQ